MARKNMYQRSDGLFEKKITVNGKRLCFRGHSEREVFKKIALFQQKEESGPTFESVAREWWQDHSSKIKYGSRHVYSAALGRAVEYFSSDLIKDIQAADINAFLVFAAHRGYAQKTIRNQLTVVRQIFLFALMQRYIRSLPTDGVRIPSGLPKHERVLPVESAVEAVKNTEPNEFILPALILYTGARCGEALALKWSDIDFVSATITINKAVVYHSNQPVISDTKTENAHRVVPLLSPLQKLLSAQPSHAENDFVIGGKSPVTKSSMVKQWEKFCRAHGLAHPNKERTEKAGRTIWACELDRHTLRHEYATILYDAGIDPKVAQELLGHADLSTTLNIYTHIRQRRLAQTAITLNNFVCSTATAQ